MSKLRKKIVVPISLTLTGCLVVAAFVLNDSLTKVDANVAFNGISDIVSSHGKDKPFNIVEVVPDKKMASIGYLIDGQEPDDWFGTLSKMSDKDGAGVKNRSAYMEGLKTKLAPITTEKKDNTKPLYYEPYEESYVSQGDDWTELALVDMDRINKGTTGYKMTEQAEGDYKFNTAYQLAVNEEGLPTGHYRQNVDHYVFMQGEDETEDGSNTETENGNQIKAPGKRGYYSVAFTAVKLPDGMTNTQYLVPSDNSQKADGNTDSGTDGNIDSSTDNTTDTGTGDDTVEKHVVYSIKSAYAIGSAEGMQNIAKYDPKAYIYRIDNSDITSPYEFVARADRMAGLPDGSKPDYEKYTYCTVEMEYVPADKITDDETYYEVDTEVPIEFNYDETGEYGAVLDSQNPYEKIDDGTPDNQPAGNTGKVILTDTDGYFDIVKDSQTYTYVGKGKLEEIKEYIKNEEEEDREVGMVIFDDELSAKQIRNIEQELQVKILDRTSLILDIFAMRAQTAAAKTQVELAQYRYMLPRLQRLWTHLERQGGGSGSGGGKGSVGLRGPGETQLEMDRRIILGRMSLLKERLAEIDKQKTTQRKNRGRMVRVALVGYTNVGKSTIMNLLSKSEVFAENKLFATLDTTVRKVVVDNLPFLLADTVGFIRKLPTDLVDSFKSTLDETREADLLLHVVDISHPDFEEQIQVVENTLKELDCADKPSMIIFNKIDNYSWVEKEEDDLTPMEKENIPLEDLKKTWMAKLNEDCLFISAKNKENIDEFREILYKKVRELHVQKYPYNDFLYQDYE